MSVLKLHFHRALNGSPADVRRTRFDVALPQLNTRTPAATDSVICSWLSIQDPMNERDYLCTNTVDPDIGYDEFKDTDNEYEGLTVVSMGKDTRRWLKGYNIL